MRPTMTRTSTRHLRRGTRTSPLHVLIQLALLMTVACGTAGPSAMDGGTTDSGPVDAGPVDAGPADASTGDSGPIDAGPMDAGPLDSGPADAGTVDAGPADTGPPDAGPADAGPMDMGPPDAGPAPCCIDDDCPVEFACESAACVPAGPTCTDGELNGFELGVDCGGPSCPACVPACDDGFLNGGETDVDCGGSTTCGRCDLGERCEVAADCAAGACTLGQCGTEGDIVFAVLDVARNGDLGGIEGADELCGRNAAEWGFRGTWRALLGAGGAGGGPSRALAELIPTAVAANRVVNTCEFYPVGARPRLCSEGTEIAPRYDDFVGDIGGRISGTEVLTFGGRGPYRTASDPPFSGTTWIGAVRLGATASDTCDDWRSDAMTDEGIGTFMPRALYFEQLTPCDIFGAVLCVRTTLACETDACRCGDGVLSGSETDADCGGSECSACRPGQECRVASDCADGVCDSGRCAAPTCSDGVRNGGETDLDCGGVCGSCPAGDTCAVAADCASGVCDLETSTCVAASCDDGVANGLETDVDCGASSACGLCANGRRCDAPGDCDSGACTAWAPGRAMRCGTTFGHLVHLTMELDGATQPVAREVIGEGAFLSAETGTLRVGFWPFPEDGRHDVLLMPQVVSIIAALEAEARARGRTLETGAGPGYRMTDPETDVYVFPAKDDSLYDEVTDLGERYARPPVVNAFTARGGVVLYMDLFANSGDDPSRNTYAEMASLFEDWALRSSTPPSTEPSFLASLDRDFGPQLPDMAPVCTPTTQSTHPLAVSPARREAPSMRFSGRGQRWVLDVVRSAAPSSFGDDWHEVNVTLADEEGFALVTHFLRSSGS